NKALNEAGFLAGLAAVFGSAVAINPKMPFPGFLALVPCLGSAFIIQSGSRAVSALILSNPVAVGIGLISYSLYLCHWPILTFYRYIAGSESTVTTFVLLALSFAVAIVMYYGIEKPFRQRREQTT